MQNSDYPISTRVIAIFFYDLLCPNSLSSKTLLIWKSLNTLLLASISLYINRYLRPLFILTLNFFSSYLVLQMVISFRVCEIHSQVVVEVAVGAEPAHDVQVPPDGKALARYKHMA